MSDLRRIDVKNPQRIAVYDSRLEDNGYKEQVVINRATVESIKHRCEFIRSQIEEIQWQLNNIEVTMNLLLDRCEDVTTQT